MRMNFAVYLCVHDSSTERVQLCLQTVPAFHLAYVNSGLINTLAERLQLCLSTSTPVLLINTLVVVAKFLHFSFNQKTYFLGALSTANEVTVIR